MPLSRQRIDWTDRSYYFWFRVPRPGGWFRWERRATNCTTIESAEDWARYMLTRIPRSAAHVIYRGSARPDTYDETAPIWEPAVDGTDDDAWYGDRSD